MSTEKDDLFDAANIPQSSWFKFVKIGDKVGGTVTKIFKKEAQGQFGAQLCYNLSGAKGIMDGKPLAEPEVSVGVKDNEFFRQRLEKVRVGDKLGFSFDKEIPATVKGNSPAKSITPFVKHLTVEERAAYMTDHPDVLTDNNF